MRAILHAAIAAVALTLGVAGPALAAGKVIVVNGNLPGVGFNDPTPALPIGGNPGLTLGEQRMNVFLFAANIWTQVLNPKVDIYVWARFVPLAPNVLGSAGPISALDWFRRARSTRSCGTTRRSRTSCAGSTRCRTIRRSCQTPWTGPNPSDEISARFSTNFNFYFGFDNNEESVPGTNDLLVVVLHEMGHGLGFSNLIDLSDGTKFLDFGDLYSQYTLDDVTNKNWNAMTDAERLASAVNIRKVSWTGLNVKKDVPEGAEARRAAAAWEQLRLSGNFFLGPRPSVGKSPLRVLLAMWSWVTMAVADPSHEQRLHAAGQQRGGQDRAARSRHLHVRRESEDRSGCGCEGRADRRQRCGHAASRAWPVLIPRS